MNNLSGKICSCTLCVLLYVTQGQKFVNIFLAQGTAFMSYAHIVIMPRLWLVFGLKRLKETAAFLALSNVFAALRVTGDITYIPYSSEASSGQQSSLCQDEVNICTTAEIM